MSSAVCICLVSKARAYKNKLQAATVKAKAIAKDNVKAKAMAKDNARVKFNEVLRIAVKLHQPAAASVACFNNVSCLA